MSTILLKLDRTVLILSFLLALHGEAAQALHVVTFETKWLILSFHAVVSLELLATTLADKHMATVLPNYVLHRRS